ncbi:glycoside hydrolase family 43 protein [Melittangium boletus]|uniref:Glycosyl hydrolase n=1 Tax=Melittangium boletus DSM 14713 TaxID=1294270 RepID=A0A250IDN6_9BACT|nr:glycoside hydrolase family 43 protein [Melittangium boletus]ATB29261.1 glycosyl hydrolase [Melittangium boletus DSM 14713]
MKTHRWIAALAVVGAALSGLGCGGEEPRGGAEDVGMSQAPLACTTRITYGNTWIHPGRESMVDIASGEVTWDGTCVNSGSNSYAVLSNGWKPYFTGNNACVMAFDSDCAGAQKCSTRVTYGPKWIHSGSGTFDDVGGRVFWNRSCVNEGSNSYAQLSNGWKPYFTGANGCAMTFRYTGCGGLYLNPVFSGGCADPGVIFDGGKYIAVCTSGGAAAAFPIRTSSDLITWTSAGHIFPSGKRPAWAKGDFWAPEIHRVGSRYIAYYTARHTNGVLSIGAASATSPLGPFTDLGWPLVHDPNMGMIDATFFTDTAGTKYLVWKADGNAVGQKTPIYAQPLSADGLSLTGTRKTLITNDRAWEGGLVEAPWVVARDGYYYLFYSGNAYYDGRYAIGVARATSPLGPYTKAANPILKTTPDWEGPGHGSVVTSPSGTSVMVYHAWDAGHTTRVMLVDTIVWKDGWPTMPGAPSLQSRPLP